MEGDQSDNSVTTHSEKEEEEQEVNVQKQKGKHFKKKLGKNKKKKWTIDQLNEVIPSTILKGFNRVCKQIKLALVLKSTKKVISHRDNNETDEYEKEAEHLKDLKNVNHSDLAKQLARKHFPEEFNPNYSEKELPAESIVHCFKTNPKYVQNLKELKVKISELQKERTELIEKEERIRINQMKGVSKKKPEPHVSARQAAVKAVFVDCLDDSSKDDSDEDSNDPEDDEIEERRKAVKMQKSLRNRVNRKRNREQKEQEAKAMEMYMPVNQRGKPFKDIDDEPESNRRDKFRKGLRENKNQQTSRPERKQFSSSSPSSKSENKQNAFETRNHHQQLDQDGVQEKKKQKIEHPLPSNSNDTQLKSMVTEGKEWKSTGVHPSWAAKQLLKNQSISIAAAPQGKKIVFDD